MKIICVGRNYADHAKELNNEVPKEAVLFLKPETAIIHKNMPFFIPDFSNEVHHELELVVKINKLGKHIQPQFAHKYYSELTVGIDFTARDVQAECKKKGLPWEKAKAFDGSALVGKFVKKDQFSDVNALNIKMTNNENVVQEGNTSDMLNSIDQLIAYISTYFTLKIGDLIFTGTPSGVAPVKKDDFLELYLEEDKLAQVNVK
ncbi:MAG: fumarylacetoacetate hydrolase family protein [Schleiferiaceae bacterium]|jgi:2-keto-4-pentenoate hydratase/2-oxohepta-3-ene-1,7-dioic acid hydratase in catechol pathway|nr:fumarylacetoacetate hydrolase family protein [Schleiferiaceae bacterium]